MHVVHTVYRKKIFCEFMKKFQYNKNCAINTLYRSMNIFTLRDIHVKKNTPYP